MANTVSLVIKAADLASRELIKVAGGLDNIARHIASLHSPGLVGLAADTVSWGAELKRVQDKFLGIEAIAHRLLGISAKLTFAGIGALATASFPIAQAASFEASMSKVQAILDDVSEESMQTMIDQAKLMGETTKFTAKESADAFTFLAMAGLSAEQSVAALPGTLELAAAAGIDLATAADLATNVLAGMGKEVGELGHVNDLLAVAASKSNTSVLELGEALKVAGPAALGSGESLERVVEVLGGLANAGIKGGEGGNAIKRMLISLLKPSGEAAATLERLGVVITDSGGNFRGLVPILQDLGRAQLSLADSSEIFGLYAAAAGVAAATQANQLGTLRIALENADGAAGRMATTMQDNVAGAFIKVMSASEGFWLAVATPLEGVAKVALETIASLISFGTAIVKSMSGVAAAVLGGIAAFGVLGTALGSLGVALGTLLLVYIKYRTAVLLVTGANWLLTVALASQRVGALANAAGFGVMYTALGKAKGAVDAMTVSSIRSAGVMGVATGALNLLKAAAIGLWNVLKLNPFIAVAAAGLAFYEFLNRLRNGYKETQQAAKDYAESVAEITAEYQKLREGYFAAQISGSQEDQITAAKDLKEWLEKLVLENENLATAAYAASDALDVETGKFRDNGEAMDELQRSIKSANFSALRQQLAGLSEELDAKRTTGWRNGFINALTGMHLSINEHLINPITELVGIHFKSFSDRAAEMEADWDQSLSAMEARTRVFLGQMMELGQIDPNLSFEEIVAWVESMPELTDEMKNAFVNAFTEIKQKAAEAGTAASTSFSAEENKVRLNQIAADYRAMADSAIAEYKRIAEASRQDVSSEGVENRNVAYQQALDQLNLYIQAVKNSADAEVSELQRVAQERTQSVNNAENATVISAGAAARIRLEIANKLAQDEVAIRQNVVAQLNALGQESIINTSAGYQQIAAEAAGAGAAQIAAEQQLQAALETIRTEKMSKYLADHRGTYEAIDVITKEASQKAFGYAVSKDNAEKEILTGFLRTAQTVYDEFVSVNRKAYGDALKEVEKYANAIKKVEDQMAGDTQSQQSDILEIRRRNMTEQEREKSLYDEYAAKLKEVQEALKAGEVERAEAAATRAIAIARGFTDEEQAIASVEKAYDALKNVRTQEKSNLAEQMDAAAQKAEEFNVKLRAANELIGELAQTVSMLDLQIDDVELSFKIPDSLREDVQKIMAAAEIDLNLSLSEGNATQAKMSIEEIMKGVVVTPEVDDSKMTEGVDDFVDRTERIFKNSKYQVEIDTRAAERKIDELIADFKRRWAAASSSSSSGTTVRRRFGGLIPGWGGGDKIRALLERGEYVLRKEAVAKYGSMFIRSINNLSFDGAIRRKNGGPVNDIISTPIPSVDRASTSDTIQVLKFAFDNGVSTDPIQVKSSDASLLLWQFKRMGRLASV